MSLATTMQAQPGVYALLLGSGVSIGSGIETGWGVFRALMIRASTALGGDDVLTIDSNDESLDSWWAAHGNGKSLGYSALLELLAPTAAARRSLLAGFFEATDDEREDGQKVPGRAHEAIADLVARGSVRVILTTNFDRLTERALEARGISPQVISTADEIAGMEPLAHARCTIVKLHGDYSGLGQRNTVDELSTYPDAQNELLARVFDEYGLIVSGWSAEWDYALVAAMKASPSRRYPWYWGQLGALAHVAKGLIASKGASLIDGVTADDLFGGLVRRLDALDALTLTSTSTSIAVAQVKRMLPNPLKHIEMRDLFENELNRVATVIADRPRVDTNSTPEEIQAVFESLRAGVDTLVQMFFEAVRLDRDRQHTDLFVWVIERAMRFYGFPTGQIYLWWRESQHYPALLLLHAGFAGALIAEHEDVLVALALRPTWRNPISSREPTPAFSALNPQRVLDPDTVNKFPRWEGMRLLLPHAHLLAEDLRAVAEDAAGGPDDYTILSNDVQYRHTLASAVLPGGRGGIFIGEYIYETGIRFETIAAEERFRATGDAAAWGWTNIADGSVYDEALRGIRDRVNRSGLNF
jgi:hypothetical protein